MHVYRAHFELNGHLDVHEFLSADETSALAHLMSLKPRYAAAELWKGNTFLLSVDARNIVARSGAAKHS